MPSDACVHMCNAGAAQDGAGLLGGPAPHTLHPQESKGTTCVAGRLVVYLYMYMFTGVPGGIFICTCICLQMGLVYHSHMCILS